MADIKKYLDDIMKAVYGEQVRGSIHDAIDAINTFTEEGKTEQDEAITEGLKNILIDLKTELKKMEDNLIKAGIRQFEIVETLPSASEASDGVIYFYFNQDTEHYDMYAKIKGTLELIDDTTIDTTGFATKEEIAPLKTKLDGISEGAQVNTIESISVNGTPAAPDEAKNVEIKAYNEDNKPKVGGRNLLLNSGVPVTNSGYRICEYKISDRTLKDGEKVTVTIKGTLGTGKTDFRIYNTSGGNYRETLILADKGNGYYQASGNWSYSYVGNTHILVYVFPSSVTAESTIEWIKLERGEIATDWSPAPEDLEAEIDDIQIGGRNYALNSSPTFTPNGWRAYTLQYPYLPIENGYAVCETWNNNYLGFLSPALSQPKVIKPGNYIISFTAYLNASFDFQEIGFWFFGAEQNTHIASIPKLSTVSTRYSIEVNITADKQYTSYGILIYDSHSHPDIKLYVKDIKIELGNKPTDWTPAPEDLETTADNFQGILPVEKGGTGNTYGYPYIVFDDAYVAAGGTGRAAASAAIRNTANENDLMAAIGAYANKYCVRAFMGVGANNYELANNIAIQQNANDNTIIGTYKGHEIATLSDYATTATAGLVKPGTGLSVSADGTLTTTLFDLCPDGIMHRNLFRGKNLGSSVTPEQLAAIKDGSFKDLFIGDYWNIDGVNWLIADMDYFYQAGDTAFTKHHLVIIPQTTLYNAVMNTTNTTEGGYMGSEMYRTGLDNAKTKIKAAFGEMVQTHRDILINATTEGHPSGYIWTDSEVELMTEVMVYGTYHYAVMNPGSYLPTKYTPARQQFAIFALNPYYAFIRRIWYWLRDVSSATGFAYCGGNGSVAFNSSSASGGVRPYFCIGSNDSDADMPVEGPEMMDEYMQHEMEE